MKAKFSVTYEIVTPESAADCEAESRGYVTESATLRDALQAVNETRTCHVDGVHAIEPDNSDRPRWITITNGQEFETAANESRALHIPDGVTRSSARRIARLVGLKHLR